MVMITRVKDVAQDERMIIGEWKYKGGKYYNGVKDEILGMRLNDSHSGEWELPTLSKLKEFLLTSFHS